MAEINAVNIDVRSKLYPARGRASAHLAIAGLKFEVRAGEFLCILGPSGCGKSTLLNLISGLDAQFEGEISFNPPTDHRLAYMFQTPRLLPWRTVLENVVLAARDAPETVDNAKILLAEVGLGDFFHAYPGQISVGMQRRVALARAFILQPTILLMDEPFVSLDESVAEMLRGLLLHLRSERPATVLFVTHDVREAIRLGDRLIILTSAPTKVARDVQCPLTPAQRTDPATIEAFRTGLLATANQSSFYADHDYSIGNGATA